jgi:acyl transferase domain-containing protein
MLRSLAELHRSGYPIDWQGFHRPFPHRLVALPGYPFQRQRYWWSRPGQGEAAASLKLALKSADGEPAEAQALIQNALGFALAAQNNYGAAVRHYRSALKFKQDYPVALNNLAFALEKQSKADEALATYRQVLELDASNSTARKRLKRLERTAV